MTQAIDLIKQRVTAALDVLTDAGKRHEGLFPSICDRESGALLQDNPPAIPGQRRMDRSFPGSNLSHDQVVLRAMRELGPRWNRPSWSDAAQAYLHRFAHHCTDTPTGLFPWGEHSFWNLADDCPGNSYLLQSLSWPMTHDHLLQAPQWLWETLWEIEPQRVIDFAQGLDGHFVSEERCEYNRHALIDGHDRPAQGVSDKGRSCDFPRHSGFFAFDWAFALQKTGRDDFRRQIQRMLDYWWTRRGEGDMLFSESRSPQDSDHFRRLVTQQTLSLGVSLLEVAAMLDDAAPDLAGLARQRGQAYLHAFLRVPHDPEAGRFISGWREDQPDQPGTMAVWGSAYGSHSAATPGLLAALSHRLTGEGPALDFALSVGTCYAQTPFPEQAPVPVRDAGIALGLLVELAQITGEATWADRATDLAQQMIEIYLDAPLPRAAAGMDYYESQCLPGYMLHSLARLVTLHEGEAITPDYTLR